MKYFQRKTAEPNNQSLKPKKMFVMNLLSQVLLDLSNQTISSSNSWRSGKSLPDNNMLSHHRATLRNKNSGSGKKKKKKTGSTSCLQLVCFYWWVKQWQPLSPGAVSPNLKPESFQLALSLSSQKTSEEESESVRPKPRREKALYGISRQSGSQQWQTVY